MERVYVYKCPTCKRYTGGAPVCKGTLDNPHPAPIKALKTAAVTSQSVVDYWRKVKRENEPLLDDAALATIDKFISELRRS